MVFLEFLIEAINNQMGLKVLLTYFSLLLYGARSLKNSFNSTNTLVSLAPPNNTLTPAQLATVYDTLINPSIPTDSWGNVCSGLGAPGATCAVTISNSAGALGRTILTILSTDQTTGYSVTLSAVNASGTVTNTTSGANLILYNGYLSNFSSVTLSITRAQGCQLCTPEILVVDEHPLYGFRNINSQIESVQYNFGSQPTNSSFFPQIQYTNWTLDNLNCQQFTAADNTSDSYVNIIFTPDGRPYNQLVLLTGGFLILGKRSSYDGNNKFMFTPVNYTLNVTTATFDEIPISTLFQVPSADVSGIYTFSSTTGIITNRLKLVQRGYGTLNTDLCSFVPLGYRYCFFTSITDNSTSTNSYVIRPATTPVVSKYFWIEQYIDTDRVLRNPKFCAMGVATSMTCTTCNTQPIFQQLVWMHNGTLQITMKTNDFLNVGNQTYRLTVRDTRNYERPLSISFNYTMAISCCLSNLTVNQPANQTYVIQQAQANVTIIVSETNACGYNVTYALDTAAPNWTSISGNEVRWYSNNLTMAPGIYQVPITVRYIACSGNQTYSTNLYIGVQICQVAVPVNQTYVIGAPNSTYDVLVAQNGGCAFQGTCSLGTPVPNWVSLNGCQVTWQTSNISIAPAQISVPITMTFNSSPSITSATTLYINLQACVGTFSVSVPTNQSYSIKSLQDSQTIVVSDTSACGYTHTCSLAAGTPSWLSVDASTCVYSWYSDNQTLANTQQTVVTIVSFNTLLTPTTYSQSFTISLSNCIGSFTVSTPTDQNYTISSPSASQTITASDTSNCGYTKTCSLAAGSPSWITVNSTTCVYSWSTTNLNLTGTNQTVSAIVIFNNLPTPTTFMRNFTISLAACVGQFSVSTTTNKNYTISSSQDSQTITASDTSNCGYTKTCSLAAGSPSWITVNSTTCVYSWFTSDVTLTNQNFTVSTIVSYNTLPTATNYTQSVMIRLKCFGNYSVSVPTNQIYLIADPQASQTITASDTSICGYTRTCYLAPGSPSWVSVNSTTCVFSWSTTNLALTNSNQIVTTIVSFNSLPTTTNVTQNFTISLQSCIGLFSVSTPTNKNYTISSSQDSQTITASDTSNCGYTKTCSLAAGSPSWITVNSTTCVVSWQTNNQTLQGTNQTVSTTVSFNTLPIATNYTKDFLIHLGCTCIPSFTLAAPQIQYRIGNPQGSQILSASDHNLCGYQVTYSLEATTPSWVTISGSTVSWQTRNLQLTPGDYIVNLTATFASQPSSQQISTVLVITLTNCIELYTLTPPQNVTYTLWGAQQNQTIIAVDSSTCGYTPSYALGISPTWVSIQGNVISWYSNDNSLNSQPNYQVNIQITLAGLVHSSSFNIQVLPCKPEYQLIAPSNVTYMVYSDLTSQTISYTQTSNSSCGYTPQCSLQSAPNWVNSSNCQINWFNKNASIPTPLLQAVKVLLTYLDYNQVENQLGNTTFYINLTANSEACKNATLIPNSISAIQLAYGNQTTFNLTPTDSVSRAFGVQQYCGDYTAVFPSSYGSWLSGIVSNYSLTLTQYQYTQSNQSVVIQFFMTNYTNITANQTIQISGQNCIISSYISSFTSINQTYMIGSGQTTILLPNYALTPNCSNYYTTTMSVSQTAGPNLSKTAYSISDQYFQVQIDDFSLTGSSLVFQVTALLSDATKTSNSNLLITLYLNASSNSSNQTNSTSQSDQHQSSSSSSQQVKSSIKQEETQKVPVFDYDMNQPDTIPCLNFSKAKSWSFTTPTVTSDPNKKLQFKFDAPGLNAIFTLVQESNYYVIKIAPKLAIQPFPGVFPSTFTLQYQGSTAQQTYQISFISDCPAQFAFGDQPKRPTPTISSITPTGLLTVKWSSAVKLPKVLNQARYLQEKYGQLNDLFSVSIGDASINTKQQPENSFNYQIVEISNITLQVQFNFSDPTKISTTQLKQDYVTLTFNNGSFFKDAENGMAVQQGLSIKAKLPRQTNPKQIQISTKGLAAAVQIGQASMIASLIAPYLLSSVLSQLLSVIRSLTIIVHMFVISLLFPANCVKFFGMLFPLVMFDILPTSSLANYIFSFSDLRGDYALTFQFNAVGYGSLLMVQNMGSMFFLMALYPFLVLGAYTFYKILACRSTPGKWILRIKRSMKSIYKGAFWTMPISFIYESYFILLVQAFVGFQGLKFTGYQLWSQVFCSTLAVITVVTFFIFPFAIWFIYKRALISAHPTPSPKVLTPLETFKIYGTLDKLKIYSSNFTIDHLKYFYQTVGCLVEDVCLEKVGVNVAILNPLVDMGRKFIIAVAVCYFTKWPTFVTFVFNFTTLFYVSFQWYYLPIKNSIEQTRLIINELTVLIVVYHLFTYTDYVDLDAQNTMGNSLIYIIILNGVINVYLSIKEPMLNLPKTLKNFFIKLKARWVQKMKCEETLCKQKNSESKQFVNDPLKITEVKNQVQVRRRQNTQTSADSQQNELQNTTYSKRRLIVENRNEAAEGFKSADLSEPTYKDSLPTLENIESVDVTAIEESKPSFEQAILQRVKQMIQQQPAQNEQNKNVLVFDNTLEKSDFINRKLLKRRLAQNLSISTQKNFLPNLEEIPEVNDELQEIRE